MAFNSFVFVISLNEMDENPNKSLENYWTLSTEITFLLLLSQCFGITLFIIFKIPLNFFQIFNRLPNMTFSFYQLQIKDEI
jgi:hypothetical protein